MSFPSSLGDLGVDRDSLPSTPPDDTYPKRFKIRGRSGSLEEYEVTAPGLPPKKVISSLGEIADPITAARTNIEQSGREAIAPIGEFITGPEEQDLTDPISGQRDLSRIRGVLPLAEAFMDPAGTAFGSDWGKIAVEDLAGGEAKSSLGAVGQGIAEKALQLGSSPMTALPFTGKIPALAFGGLAAKGGGEAIGRAASIAELKGWDSPEVARELTLGGIDLALAPLMIGHGLGGLKAPLGEKLPDVFSKDIVWEAPESRITGVIPEESPALELGQITVPRMGSAERRVLEGGTLTPEEIAKIESDPLFRDTDREVTALQDKSLAEMKAAEDYWRSEVEDIKRLNPPDPNYLELKPIAESGLSLAKDILAPDTNLPGGSEAGVINLRGPKNGGKLSEQADLLHRLLKGSKQTKINVTSLDRIFQEMGIPLSPEMKADLPGLLKELAEGGYAKTHPGGTYTILSGAGRGLEKSAPSKAGPSELEQQLQATLDSVKSAKPLTPKTEVTVSPKEEVQTTAPIIEEQAPKPRTPKGTSFEVTLSDGSAHKIKGPNVEAVRGYIEKKLEGSNLKVLDISEPMTSIDKAVRGIKSPETTAPEIKKEGFINHPAVKVLNSIKSIAYGGDVGHLLRQGKQMNAELLFSKNADKVFKQFPVLFKAAKSESFFNDFHKKLASDPDIARMVGDFKLDMPGLGEHLKEEAFHGGELAESIPVLGKYYVKPSNRVYTTGLNFLRAEVAKQGIESLRSKGFTFENSPEKYRSLARGINIISQRGDFNPAYQKVFSDASAFFGAPRAKAARFQQLTGSLWKGGEEGRLARRSMAKAMALNVGLIAILKAKYGDDLEFVTDPDRTDYLKLRKGNVTVDPLMGLGVTIRTAVRIKRGAAVSVHSGKRYQVPPDKAIGKELTGMAAPGVSAGFQALFEKDFQGFQRDRISALANVLPLTYRQIDEIYKEEGMEGIIFILLQMGGEGVDTFNYDEAKAEQERLKSERGLGNSSRSSTGRRGSKRRRYSF